MVLMNIGLVRMMGHLPKINIILSNACSVLWNGFIIWRHLLSTGVLFRKPQSTFLGMRLTVWNNADCNSTDDLSPQFTSSNGGT